MTKRKNHSAEFKARVALDAIREGKPDGNMTSRFNS